MPSEHFERKLREKLGQVEVPPRPEVWDALQARLQPPPARRRGAALLWIGAMTLSTAAAIALLWLFWPGPDTSPAPAPAYAETPAAPAGSLEAASPAVAPVAPVVPLTESATPTPPSPQPLVAAANRPSPSPAVSPSSRPGALLAVTPLAPRPVISLGQPQLAQPGPAVDRPLPAVQAMAALETAVAPPESPAVPPLDFPAPQSRDRQWAYRLSAGSALQGSGADLGLMAMNQSGSNLRADYINLTGGQTLFGNLPAENLQAVSLPQAQFNASFRLEYRLNRHWGLESGLGFTLFEQGTAQSTWFAPGSSVDFEDLAGPVEPSELSVQASSSQTFQPLQLEVPLYLNRYLPAPGRGQLLLSTGLSLNGSLFSAASMEKAAFAGEANADRALNPGGSLVVTPTTDPGSAQTAPTGEALLGLRRFHSHAALRLLYQLPLHGRYAFFFGPELRYQLSPMYSGPAATVVEPYHLGFQLGLRL